MFAQCLFQRVKISLERPPCTDTFAVKRLAHLRRAGGAHSPLGIVKIKTGLLKRQAEIIQHAAQLAFQVFTSRSKRALK